VGRGVQGGWRRCSCRSFGSRVARVGRAVRTSSHRKAGTPTRPADGSLTNQRYVARPTSDVDRTFALISCEQDAQDANRDHACYPEPQRRQRESNKALTFAPDCRVGLQYLSGSSAEKEYRLLWMTPIVEHMRYLPLSNLRMALPKQPQEATALNAGRNYQSCPHYHYQNRPDGTHGSIVQQVIVQSRIACRLG